MSIFNPDLETLVGKLRKVEADIEWSKHQHKTVMRQLHIDKRRIELMIEIENLNNQEHTDTYGPAEFP